MHPIKISAAYARQRFNGCDPDYIANVCKARCCESSTAPSGIMVTIHASEEQRIQDAGGVVQGGFLQPAPGCKKCPFKTDADLCGLHEAGAKPFGCIASPFTLNAKDTLIIRNRYRLLKCYNDGRKLPAYEAFRASLDLILGAEQSAKICAHLLAGGGDVQAEIADDVYARLKDNDAAKHGNGRGKARVFGQDLMRKEHTVGGKRAIPGGGTGKNSAYAFRQPDGSLKTGEAAQAEGSGTSIFDPVLCELAYSWFCPPMGEILDPFAGGSVRGIVAGVTGHGYIGVELRPEQCAANEAQLEAICPDANVHWLQGDAFDLPTLAPGAYDFIFSCPPYGNLEEYSDNPLDLSRMADADFDKAYRIIIERACAMLRPDRFACFVVGDYRDKAGNYRGFPGRTIAAFEGAGLKLYNDAILLTAIGSLPVRVGRQFKAARKLGKTHQNVLVFLKGDARKATAACGDVHIPELDVNE